ncbi:MAG: helix-turn-helix transcriptional regulator [Bacteroidales bacterium]|nr:helix-turn-helix transcriptional regulator [Bacteroidales bacterium]
MNTRLLRFLEAENISQAQFADTIGVARASISHIISGRNKPGFDFIVSTARHFPALNIEWLLTGAGRMYKTTESELFGSQEDSVLLPSDNQAFDERQKNPQNCKRKISHITVFYSDGTFEEFK